MIVSRRMLTYCRSILLFLLFVPLATAAPAWQAELTPPAAGHVEFPSRSVLIA